MIGDLKTLTVIFETAAALGLITQCLLVWDAWQGWRALRERGVNGQAAIVSKMDIRTDIIGALVMAIFLTIGVTVHLTAFRGAPPFNALETWAIVNAAWVLRYGLISVIVLLVVKAVWKRYDRHRLLQNIVSSDGGS